MSRAGVLPAFKSKGADESALPGFGKGRLVNFTSLDTGAGRLTLLSPSQLFQTDVWRRVFHKRYCYAYKRLPKCRFGRTAVQVLAGIQKSDFNTAKFHHIPLYPKVIWQRGLTSETSCEEGEGSHGRTSKKAYLSSNKRNTGEQVNFR